MYVTEYVISDTMIVLHTIDAASYSIYVQGFSIGSRFLLLALARYWLILYSNKAFAFCFSSFASP